VKLKFEFIPLDVLFVSLDATEILLINELELEIIPSNSFTCGNSNSFKM